MIVIEGYKPVISKKNKLKFGRGRAYKCQSVLDFEDYCSRLAYQYMKDHNLTMIKNPVRLTLDIVFGDRRRRDLQNCYDCVCDSLNNIVYEDDSQITELSGTKRYEKGIWKFTITVEEIK